MTDATIPAPAVLVAPYATINVKNHIPVTLELAKPNFNQWEPFFTSLCGKFALLSHIDELQEARPTDPSWGIVDACVRSWLLGSAGPDVIGLAAAPNQTARELWVAIKRLFEANKAPRAIFLSHEFHSMTQGDSSINDYAQRMKATADALRDVGRTITDAELVLNLLRGLNPRFASTADNIADSHPLPDFATTREKLVLKELCLANEGTVAAQTALHASCGTNCRTTPPPTAAAPLPVDRAVTAVAPAAAATQVVAAAAGRRARASLTLAAVPGSQPPPGTATPLGPPGFISSPGARRRQPLPGAVLASSAPSLRLRRTLRSPLFSPPTTLLHLWQRRAVGIRLASSPH
jgi:hypothetical protein